MSTKMTLSEAQVEDIRAALTGNRMTTHKAGEQHIADALTRALDYQMNALCDLAMAQIRAQGQAVAWAYYENGRMTGLYDSPCVGAIPLYAAPQPAQGMVMVPEIFFRHLLSVIKGVIYLCQPKPRQSYEDDTEHNGGLALAELDKCATDLVAMLAAAQKGESNG